MTRNPRRSYVSSPLGLIALGIALAITPALAAATQPLDTFLARATSHNFDTREQRAIAAQRDWEGHAALGRMLPTFTVRGAATRNQVEVIVPAGTFGATSAEMVVQRRNALTASLQLDVPLVDLAAHQRYRSATHLADAEKERFVLTHNDVAQAIARSYYNFLGSSALVKMARHTLEVANENLDFVDLHRGAGSATDLDLERARANVELANQQVADAELARALSRRALETLSGVAPEPADEFPEDDLRGEGNIDEWLEARDTPSDRVNTKLREAASSAKRAAAYTLAPVLSLNAQQHFTNQPGFLGRNDYYLLQAMLSWRLDYDLYATAQAQAAAAEAQLVRSARARRAVEDDIFEAYHRVEVGIARSRAARSQAGAAKRAAALADQRYRAGGATQLDVTQAQREAFLADANRIQADADLMFARASLRVTAGQFLRAESKRAPGSSPALLAPADAAGVSRQTR